MVKRYHVHLSADERTQLEHVIARGKTSARVIARARILLKAAEGWQDEEIVDAVGSSVATVARVRRRFVEGGIDGVLKDKPQKAVPILSRKRERQ